MWQLEDPEGALSQMEFVVPKGQPKVASLGSIPRGYLPTSIMKVYYVGSNKGWFLVNCRTKRQAKSEGVFEFGRGNVKEVREATPEEIITFQSIKGKSALEPSIG